VDTVEDGPRRARKKKPVEKLPRHMVLSVGCGPQPPEQLHCFFEVHHWNQIIGWFYALFWIPKELFIHLDSTFLQVVKKCNFKTIFS